MKINNKVIVIILLFIIAFTIRVIQIDSIPPGVFDDEANYGYDAWLISQTGKDQWGNFLPLQFKGFGDYRLPVTQYLIVPFVKIFGLNALALRLPSAIFGSLTVFIAYLLIKKLLIKEKYGNLLGLITAVVLAFNPWHFALSRLVMEANIGLLFTLLSIYFYLDSQKIKNFILALVFAILSFYTYYGYRLFLILYLLILTSLNKRIIFTKVKYKIIIILLGLLLMTPMLKTLSEGGLARLRQINFWQDKSVLADIHEYRGECRQNLSDNICKVFFNQYAALGEKFIINYFHHFSPNFLFFAEFGKSWNILPSSHSYFYLLDFILLIIGLFFLVIHRTGKEIYFFLLLAPIADSLTGNGNFSRSFIMVFPIAVFLSAGWLAIYNFFSQKKVILTLLISLYGYFCLCFFINYFIYFPKQQSQYTHYAYYPLFEYLKKIDSQYDNIYISKVNHDQRQYIFYLYNFKIPAKQYFNLNKKFIVEDNGWIYIQQLGKYHFINQADSFDNYPPKSLLIIDPEGVKYLPNYDKEKNIIYYKNRHPAFNIYDIDELKANLLLKKQKNNKFL